MFRHPVAGGDLVLALMADRTIRILHKGVVCDPHEWPADQPERAVREYLTLKEKLFEHIAASA